MSAASDKGSERYTFFRRPFRKNLERTPSSAATSPSLHYFDSEHDISELFSGETKQGITNMANEGASGVNTPINTGAKSKLDVSRNIFSFDEAPDRHDTPEGTYEYKNVIDWFDPLEKTKESYDKFVRVGNDVFSNIRPADRKLLMGLIKKLARDLGLDLDVIECKTWPGVKKALKVFMNIKENEATILGEILVMKRLADEHPFNFYVRIQNKAKQYTDVIHSKYDGLDAERKELEIMERIKDKFIASLEGHIEIMVRQKRPRDINEAYKFFDDITEDSTSIEDSRETEVETLRKMIKELSTMSKTDFKHPEVHQNSMDNVTCQLCFEVGHVAWTCKKFVTQKTDHCPF